MSEILKLADKDLTDCVIDWGANPNGSSGLIKVGNKAVIVRPLGINSLGLSVDEEITRRQEAIELYRNYMPEVVLPSKIKMLNGEYKDKAMYVYARITPWVNDVKRVLDIKKEELLSADHELLSYVHFGALKALVLDQKVLSTDVMVGELDGERVIFCDPDWYLNLDELGVSPLHAFSSASFRRFQGGVSHLIRVSSEFKTKSSIDSQMPLSKSTRGKNTSAG